jgi:hypothetical protein
VYENAKTTPVRFTLVRDGRFYLVYKFERILEIR